MRVRYFAAIVCGAILAISSAALAHKPVRPSDLDAPNDIPLLGECSVFDGNRFQWRDTCGGGTSAGQCHMHQCSNELCFNPTDCPAGKCATGVEATGDLICTPCSLGTPTVTPTSTATPTQSPTPTLSPTPTATASPADDQVQIADSGVSVTWRTVPDSDGTTQKLQYDQTTNTLSAGTDDDVPEVGDYSNLTLTGDVTSVGSATTVADNAVDGTDVALGGDLLGDTWYYNGTDFVRLAGNLTVSRQFLRQIGNGTVSAAPAWATIVASTDVTPPGNNQDIIVNNAGVFGTDPGVFRYSIADNYLLLVAPSGQNATIDFSGNTLTQALLAYDGLVSATYSSFQAGSGGSSIVFRRGRGTNSVKVGLNDGDDIGRFEFQPYDSAVGIQLGASFGAVIGAVPTAGAAPTILRFRAGSSAATQLTLLDLRYDGDVRLAQKVGCSSSLFTDAQGDITCKATATPTVSPTPTATITPTPTVTSTPIAGDVTDVGDCTSGACAPLDGATTNIGLKDRIVFEGTTVNTAEVSLIVGDPSIDTTATLPGTGGTIVLADDVPQDNKTLIGASGLATWTAVPHCDEATEALRFNTGSSAFSCDGLETQATVIGAKVAVSASATNYLGLSGGVDSLEANMSMPFPMLTGATGAVLMLSCACSGAPDDGVGTQSYAFTLRKNAADTAVTCTISEAATTCTSQANNDTIAANDLFATKVIPAGTPVVRSCGCSYVFMVENAS